MNRFLIRTAAPLILTGLGLAQQKNIVEVAAGAGQFNTLVAAVKAAGLVDTLSGKGPFTVFAPTDAAFAKLGEKTIANLLKPENKAQLVAVLTYHVVPQNVPAAKVVGLKAADSVQGCTLPITVAKDKVTVAGANVVKTDVLASNGVIHVVDAVMLPPGNLVQVAKKAGKFATLLAAAKAGGLVDALSNGGPFTVFAPTDEAFAALGDDKIASLLKPENKARLVSILKHHVVAGRVPSAKAVKLKQAKTIGGSVLQLKFDGKTLRVGNGKVVATDVQAQNGVIHVVDAVLLPNTD